MAVCLEDIGTPVPFLWRIRCNFFKKKKTVVPWAKPTCLWSLKRLRPLMFSSYFHYMPFPCYSSTSAGAGEEEGGERKS